MRLAPLTSLQSKSKTWPIKWLKLFLMNWDSVTTVQLSMMAGSLMILAMDAIDMANDSSAKVAVAW
jgi:hypothetical protein